jgi:hypothetical protein
VTETFQMEDKTAILCMWPKHALQRTRSGVTLAPACHLATFAHPARHLSASACR